MRQRENRPRRRVRRSSVERVSPSARRKASSGQAGVFDGSGSEAVVGTNQHPPPARATNGRHKRDDQVERDNISGISGMYGAGGLEGSAKSASSAARRGSRKGDVDAAAEAAAGGGGAAALDVEAPSDDGDDYLSERERLVGDSRRGDGAGASGDEESGDDPELLTVPAVMCGDEGVLSRAGFLNAQSLALLAVVVVLTVAAFNDLATSPAADGGGGSGVGGGDHQNNDDTVVPGGTPGAGAVAGGGDATEVGVPVSRVWSYGWITAASTGLGALPFFWLHKVDKWWLGICNAAAAGMMAAASIGLMVEACDEANVDRAFRTPAWVRMVLGIILGGLFLRQTQTILDQYEHLKFAGLSGVDAKKMLLIMAVMTLHSCAEGVGIGVSFVGDIGPFISTALAIHNVPEGLAICLVLIPREVHLIDAALWAIFSSMPQPLMAVPAYMSVSAFIPFLPLGLGFAAGAMGWVCAFDLAPEAISECGKKWTAVTAAAAACAMGYAQIALR